MVLVLFEGEPDREALVLPGSVVTVRGAVASVRNGPRAVRVDSGRQLDERAGVATAARLWSQSMTAGNKSSFSAASSCVGLSGFWLWVYLVSAFRAGALFIDPGNFGDWLSDPSVTACGLAEDGVEVPMNVSVPGAPSGTSAVVLASRPLVPGRQPRRTDYRSIGAIPVNQDVDVADAYRATFGGLPVPGQVFGTQVVAANPASLSLSCPALTICIPGGAGSACEFEVVNPPADAYSLIDCRARVSLSEFSPNYEFEVSVEGYDWGLYVPVSITNDWTWSYFQISNFWGFCGSQSVALSIFDVGLQGVVCLGSVDFNVPC